MSKWGSSALRRENSRKNMKAFCRYWEDCYREVLFNFTFMASKKLWEGMF